MRTTGNSFRAWLAAATCLTAVPTLVHAQTTPQPAAPAAPAAATPADQPPPGYWINGIHLSAQFEAGIMANPAAPKLNVGHLFTDRANQPDLNQVLLGAEKKLDPKATGFDWGFKLSLLYGSDARYTHFLGFLDQSIPKDQRNQIDVVEASGSVHFPVPIFEGGLDVKAGLYATPLGFETIDPSTNPFYSHSYIFNYALPLKHMGVLSISHVTSMVDIYFGLDTGSNTTFGPQGDNNSSFAGIGGVNLTLMDGNLTILALTHMGPENPSRVLSPIGFNASGYWRFFNDITVTWKATDKLTLVTEAAWIRDDFGVQGFFGHPAPANGFGIAQYAAYTLTDNLTLNGRLEVFRDDNGFFVGAFPGNYDPVLAQKGLSNTSYFPPAATYGAITIGMTYKPDMPPPITALLIRPEIRYDQSLGGNKVFNRPSAAIGFKDTGSLTFGADVVLTF